jgi:drug/metabolite transporter (DMT)-like permease
LIKDNLAALDASFVAAVRLWLSFLVFLPFLRLRGLARCLWLRLALTGSVQFGVMYLAYIYSFQFLKAYEVALFTILTPLYVTLINDAREKRFHALSLLAALLAIGGTLLVKGSAAFAPALLRGFLIVQVSNLAFAFGQIEYKALLKDQPHIRDRDVFGLLYLGGALMASLAAVFSTPWGVQALQQRQLVSLLYLGVVASGVGFFLWNAGARKVNAGTLAVLNNLKIPLGVAVSLVVFGEHANLPRLLLGGAVMALALALNEWALRRSRLATL